ncbi:MAG: DEAD/DEAH box helicase [Coleofasciculus sp. C1-SOL-03]|uniref:DEAD/DEAH box helicase n=1 Tax=Coleofasciculus sp. C1-SOL-03 TaxID=3069522 RepID=UPI00330536C1
MSHYLDPIAAVEQPRQDLIRYLLTAYPLRDPHLRYGLEEQLKQPGTIWQYPYLEGSQPYQTTKSVSELVKLDVLHPDVAHLFTPAQRPLYKHQEQAVRAVVEQQQNIVVATGTGSGKTECFLIPIMNRLLQEGATSLRSNPGVRVLILYPMNALVNDQVKRLRQLLCQQQQPLIRFGFYTSRTEQTVESRLQMLRSQARLVPASELADPDTVVVFPEPSWGELSLPQLRQKLGIDGILASQVKQVFYRDRYLNGQRANFLAELLQGEGLSANSQVTILTLETSQSPPASELKAELETALIGLKAIEIQPKVTVQPCHQRSHFPHARELEIQGHDQQKYKVIFDRGLDFLEKVENRETYRIKHPTYVAVIRQQ